MREPIRDKGRLEHIMSAISNIEEFVDGYTQETMVTDKLRLHATVYNVQVIGEATYKLSPEFKQSHTDTPWSMIEKMRHILVHDYYQVNNDILWTVVKEDIPLLKLQIAEYLKEFEA